MQKQHLFVMYALWYDEWWPMTAKKREFWYRWGTYVVRTDEINFLFSQRSGFNVYGCFLVWYTTILYDDDSIYLKGGATCTRLKVSPHTNWELTECQSQIKRIISNRLLMLKFTNLVREYFKRESHNLCVVIGWWNISSNIGAIENL